MDSELPVQLEELVKLRLLWSVTLVLYSETLFARLPVQIHSVAPIHSWTLMKGIRSHNFGSNFGFIDKESYFDKIFYQQLGLGDEIFAQWHDGTD